MILFHECMNDKTDASDCMQARETETQPHSTSNPMFAEGRLPACLKPCVI